MLPDFPPALLALADGTIFAGHSIGAAGHSAGEVVFNTALTGYQEILTDPSYCRQIVTLTYPHIGNTGANGDDVESSRIHAAAFVPDPWSSTTGGADDSPLAMTKVSPCRVGTTRRSHATGQRSSARRY